MSLEFDAKCDFIVRPDTKCLFNLISCSVLRLILILDLTLASCSHLLIQLTDHLLSHHVHHRITALCRHNRCSSRCHHHRCTASGTRREPLLLLLRLHSWLEYVHVAWIVDLINYIARLHLANSTLAEPVLALVEVVAHLLELLQEAFLLLNKVARNRSLCLSSRTHSHLLLNAAALLFAARIRCDVMFAHKVQ